MSSSTYQFNRRKRGSAYVIVLAISMLVSVIGVSALIAVRVQLCAVDNMSDCTEARLAAQSAIELARLWIKQSPNWRTTRPHGNWVVGQSLGSGTISVSVQDPLDGDLADDPRDSVIVTGIGHCRGARQKLAVTLVPRPVPYDCLAVAIAATGNVSGDADVTANRPITSNASIAITGFGMVDANVEAVGSITGSNYLGSKVSGAGVRKFPTPADVFAYYIANGTAIPYAATGGLIQKVLMSPESNPYTGAKNPLGIYIIDCANNKIEIRKSRIVGTLVLINPRSDSKIDNEVNWSPAVANYPAMLVDGSIGIEIRQQNLSESTENTNFNPPHTPYNGASNGTKTDTYPSEINGLIYVSGNVGCKNGVTIKGSLIVGGTLGWQNELKVTYDPQLYTNPPVGFFDPPPMQPLAGTWMQLVD